MEDGEVGHLGLVIVTLERNPEVGVATIHLPKMEGIHVDQEIWNFKQTNVKVNTYFLFCKNNFAILIIL